MRERPIPFSGPMVRAILDGRKTQTRRVVTGRVALEWLAPGMFTPEYVALPENGLCPFGVPGDRLWVRETWAHYQTVNSIRKTDGRSLSEVSDGLAGYKADGHESIEDFREHVRLMHGCDLESVEINGNKWRPSIFMPRWASRLLLEVKAVRVERLQEISEEDAAAEGVEPIEVGGEGGICPSDWSHRYGYMRLWDSINAKRGHSWESNPWVWVIEFERVKP